MKYTQRFGNILLPILFPYIEKLSYTNSINLNPLDLPVIAHSAFVTYIRSTNSEKQCIRYVETAEKVIIRIQLKFRIIIAKSTINKLCLIVTYLI
jgi:hypothetical protein